jgi:hypothetical protein
VKLKNSHDVKKNVNVPAYYRSVFFYSSESLRLHENTVVTTELKWGILINKIDKHLWNDFHFKIEKGLQV